MGTSARLLETSPEQKQERAEFSSYTLDSKQSTTTFNSNVFVPSISSDVYGQVVDKPGVNALNTLRRQKPFHSNNIQSGYTDCPGPSQESLKYEQIPTSEKTLRKNNLDFRENIGKQTKCYFNKTLDGGDMIQCPNEVVMA